MRSGAEKQDALAAANLLRYIRQVCFPCHLHNIAPIIYGALDRVNIDRETARESLRRRSDFH